MSIFQELKARPFVYPGFSLEGSLNRFVDQFILHDLLQRYARHMFMGGFELCIKKSDLTHYNNLLHKLADWVGPFNSLYTIKHTYPMAQRSPKEHLELLLTLVRYGFPTEIRNHQGLTILQQLVLRNGQYDMEYAGLLVAKREEEFGQTTTRKNAEKSCDIDAYLPDGETLLTSAIKSLNFDLVIRCLHLGANTKAKNRAGQDAKSCVFADQAPVFKANYQALTILILSRYEADKDPVLFEVQSIDGKRALMLGQSDYKNHMMLVYMQVVQLLYRLQESIKEARNPYQRCKAEMPMMILLNGTNVRFNAHQLAGLLEHAVVVGSVGVVQWVCQKNFRARFLVKPHAQSIKQHMLGGSFEIVRALLRQSVPLSFMAGVYKYYDNTLLQICKNGHIETAKLLMDFGASVPVEIWGEDRDSLIPFQGALNEYAKHNPPEARAARWSRRSPLVKFALVAADVAEAQSKLCKENAPSHTL